MRDQVVVDLQSLVLVEYVSETYKENWLNYGTKRVIEAIYLFLKFRKMPAEEVHYNF